MIIGLAGLGLEDEVVAEAVLLAAALHTIFALFITAFMVYIVTLDEEKGRFREFLPFAAFSALGFGIPYVLVAWLVGPELPAIVGGASAMVAIAYAAHHGFLLPDSARAEARERKPMSRVVYAFVPFAVMAVALVLSRTVMQLRETLQSVSLSLDGFRGVELSQSLTPLYTPYFYFGLALITALLLFRVRRQTLAKSVASTWQKLRVASVVLLFIIAMTQLLLLSGNNAADLPSIPEVLGQGLARVFNDTFVLVSAFVGALGSFMTGSATVSNLLFGGLQLDTARALSMAVPSILALQLVGAGVGNMISLQNIAMAAGAVGLEAREGQVIRETIIPMLVVCTAAGLLFLFW